MTGRPQGGGRACAGRESERGGRGQGRGGARGTPPLRATAKEPRGAVPRAEFFGGVKIFPLTIKRVNNFLT